MAIPIRSPEEIERLARAGAAVWDAIALVVGRARPGVRTRDLDDLAREALAQAGAEPLMPGEPGPAGPFPGAVCVTVNEEATHAPPGDRILREGDLISVDLAARLDGWCADAAVAALVGSGGGEGAALAAAARRVLDAAIRAIGPGIRWSAVRGSIAAAASLAGVRLVRGLAAGHGIGRSLHEPPTAPGEGGDDFVLRPGMVLALEPIVTRGTGELVWLDDGWTGATRDRAWVCHEERTIAVLRGGCRLLTGPAGQEIGRAHGQAG